MFTTDKQFNELKITKMKLTRPKRAGQLWKGIPFKDVVQLFTNMCYKYGLAWTEQELSVATGGRHNSSIVVSVPFNTWNDKLIAQYQHLEWTPVIGICVSNEQEFVPTMFLGAKSKAKDGPKAYGLVVPYKHESKNRQTLNFELVDFLNEGFDLFGRILQRGNLHNDIGRIERQPLFKEWEDSIARMMVRIARQGILAWSRLKAVDDWARSQEPLHTKCTLLDFGYVVSKAMIKNDPTKQPEQLQRLWNTLVNYQNANA